MPFFIRGDFMARMYNCKCGQKHPVGTECPNKYKYKRENSSEENKFVNRFYNSKAWKDKREEIKSLDKGICQRCLIKFGIVTIENLEVHHIEPLTTKWERRLQNDNLITLCLQCHRWIDIKNSGRLDFEWSRVEEEYTFEFR